MKYLIYTILALSIGLLIFHATQLDFQDLFSHESSGALIGVLSSLCVIVVMCILLITRKIRDKSREMEQRSRMARAEANK